MSPIRLRVEELRKAKTWTQEELARRAGVSRVTVNRIEGEENRRVDYDVLEKLANALGVNAAVLIDHRRTTK
jgi:transcriptional regulator with XRE-family HTH domain